VVTFLLNHPIYTDEKRDSVISLVDIRSYSENVTPLGWSRIAAILCVMSQQSTAVM